MPSIEWGLCLANPQFLLSSYHTDMVQENIQQAMVSMDCTQILYFQANV